jgi:hypothetical protein
MISLRKASLYIAIGAFGLGLAACSKHDAALETDYATKKASAETLVGQINGSMSGMKTDHDNWMKALADAAAKPGADTAKISAAKAALTQHEADMNTIAALEDSVNLYMNASPDQADAFKNADERLGTNSNDLSDKWKAQQDAHAKMGQTISQFASAPATDTAKPKAEAKPHPKMKEAPKSPEAAKAVHPGGVPRKSAK